MSQPIYGVMAEFDNPTALVNAARAARGEGLPQAGRVFAVSHRGIERRAASASQQAAAASCCSAGIAGGTLGYLLQYLRHGDLLSRSTSPDGRCTAGPPTSSLRSR